MLAGFRTLGLVSTFIAGAESQCLGLTANRSDSNDRFVQAINALLLIGLLLSCFGAVTSLFAARWFDLLRGDEIKLLDYRWDCARAAVSGFVTGSHGCDTSHQPECKGKEIQEQIDKCKLHKRNRILAVAIFIPFYMIVLYVSLCISWISY
ncbi:hypothetical protein FRC08_001183 [Ceratobasidium sp. 394]|nr:hypothetical protein FRC08_001183 [Ceratobasidium sp. 394]